MIPQEEYIINELELDHLPEAEKTQIVESIRGHMEEVMIETTLHNLNPEQLASAKRELIKNNFSEDEIMRITSTIPFLRDKLNNALAAEWDLIKTSYGKIK